MKFALFVLAALLGLFASTQATVFFKETFDSSWEQRWVVSDWKKSEGQSGKWGHSATQWYGDEEKDKGIQTSQDAKFYAISAKMTEEPFTNKDKDLVIQFQVKFPQKIDCGGGYIKLLPSNLDQKKFSGDSEYSIMFGPDICGTSTRKTHVIFNYKGTNHLIEKEIRCETDQISHVYTLIVHPDNTYEVRIDGQEKQKGSLSDDWKFLPDKEIKDPSAKKPADWVDEAKIPDPTASKPDGWDDIPAKIVDPEASKPDDWDDELDGDWEPPMIDNPEYKGEWEAPMIDNPDYKGPWIHPMIPNPDYYEDNNIYIREKLQYVGIELWQVKSGTWFDNIIVTDSVAEAEEFMKETWSSMHTAEKAMFDKLEEEKRKKEEAERAQAEKEREKEAESLETEENEDDLDDDLEDEFAEESVNEKDEL